MSPRKANPTESRWSSTTAISNWSPDLIPGPYWPSFEQFRTAGVSGLEGINLGSVGTLRCKFATFRVLREEDFQKLVGLASEVHRLKHGITLVVQAAKVVCRHPEEETLELLINSASMLGESHVLPERAGHDDFEITNDEATEFTDKESVKSSDVPRPAL